MSDPSPEELTQLIAIAADGDRSATDRLFEVVYQELREVARARRRW